jgi:trypsin
VRLLSVLFVATCCTITYAIVNGIEATINEYQFVASIAKVSDATENYEFRCSGTVIDPQVVLTAASCVDSSLKAANYQLRVGSDSVKEGGEVVSVRQIVQHPQWDSNRLINDIALLFTDAILTDIDGVAAAPRATGFVEPSDTIAVRALGWGTTENNASSPASQLQQADMVRQHQAACRRQYLFDFSITNGMFCFELDVVSGFLAPPSICNGDTGGPLLRTSLLEAPEVQGVISFYGSMVSKDADICTSSPYANVAAYIYEYNSFIDQTIEALV